MKKNPGANISLYSVVLNCHNNNKTLLFTMGASQDFNENEFLLFNWKSVDMGMILLVYSVLHVDNLF